MVGVTICLAMQDKTLALGDLIRVGFSAKGSLLGIRYHWVRNGSGNLRVPCPVIETLDLALESTGQSCYCWDTH
jgi:hypothetical protein